MPFIEPLQPPLPILPESRQADAPTDSPFPVVGQGDLFAPETAAILAVVCPRQRDEHSPAGRELVRDLLLRWRSVGPQLVNDRDVRDVLAEERHPSWLASVGVIRHVWRTGARPTEQDFDRLVGSVLPPDDAERARQFWICLTVSSSGDVQTERIHDARRRMKQLDADLHRELFERR